MADYQCRYCQDRGNCRMCSWFFEPDVIHHCGHAWNSHNTVEGIADCPKRPAPRHRADTVDRTQLPASGRHRKELN